MFNNLIGKNKELGRFLFCERYTLPPVKNAMYIAEGQDLKRGAVVDVNGVLVGTNSLIPYAVLEFDCDTRNGGKQASVFIKGEFNFDKLSFAEGLEKSDMDNIVYNGSGLGIVIKPYEYDTSFTHEAPIAASEVVPEYNKYSQYHVGTSVTYKGKIYICKEDTSGEWDASCWSSSWAITTGYDIHNFNDTIRKQGTKYTINIVASNRTYKTFKLKDDGDAQLVINVGTTTDAIVHITEGLGQVTSVYVKRGDKYLTLIGVDGDITEVYDEGGCTLILRRNGIGGDNQAGSCVIQILGDVAIFRFPL